MKELSSVLKLCAKIATLLVSIRVIKSVELELELFYTFLKELIRINYYQLIRSFKNEVSNKLQFIIGAQKVVSDYFQYLRHILLHSLYPHQLLQGHLTARHQNLAHQILL
jgi:hypothetical protein